MDAYKMMNLLGYRLEDSESNLFTDAFKIKAVNNGIIKLVQAIDNNYLTELQVLKSNLDLGEGLPGYAPLSSANLGYVPLRGGQGILKVRDYTTGTFCLQVDMDEIKKTENTYLAPSIDNPVFYIFQNNLYVLPTTIRYIDIFFIKIPTTLIYKFIGTTSGGGLKITADASQGLVEGAGKDDYYNNFSVYSVSDNKYSIITDYTGTTREFIISPAVTDSLTSKYFYLMRNDFDALMPQANKGSLNIAPEINPSIHEIAISFAESYCWAMDNNVARSKIAFDQAMSEVTLLNSRYTEAEGIGTCSSKRS